MKQSLHIVIKDTFSVDLKYVSCSTIYSISFCTFLSSTFTPFRAATTFVASCDSINKQINKVIFLSKPTFTIKYSLIIK